MQKVNDLNESLWRLPERKRKQPGNRIWFVFNFAVAALAIWAIVYGVVVVNSPKNEAPVINSVRSYSEAFGLAHTDTGVQFSYMGSPDDLPGIRNTVYAGPLENPQVVVFEFNTAAEADSAQAAYGEDMETVVYDNLIIASTSGPVPRMFYDFLGRE